MPSELVMSRSRAGEVAGTREEERRLAQQTAQARAALQEARNEAFAKERQLEQAQRRWRCHRHDGATKLRLLEEQARPLSKKSHTPSSASCSP